jgi:hypothetical protein
MIAVAMLTFGESPFHLSPVSNDVPVIDADASVAPNPPMVSELPAIFDIEIATDLEWTGWDAADSEVRTAGPTVDTRSLAQYGGLLDGLIGFGAVRGASSFDDALGALGGNGGASGAGGSGASTGLGGGYGVRSVSPTSAPGGSSVGGGDPGGGASPGSDPTAGSRGIPMPISPPTGGPGDDPAVGNGPSTNPSDTTGAPGGNGAPSDNPASLPGGNTSATSPIVGVGPGGGNGGPHPGDGDTAQPIMVAGKYSPGHSPGLDTYVDDPGTPDVDDGHLVLNGILIIEIGGLERGTEYDAIDAETVTLGGTLKVVLISWPEVAPVFEPSLGNIFDIIIADEIFGEFLVFDFAPLDGDLIWFHDIIDIYGDNGPSKKAYRLTVGRGNGPIEQLVVSQIDAIDIPEPGTILIFLAVSFGTLLRRHRSRRCGRRSWRPGIARNVACRLAAARISNAV